MGIAKKGWEVERERRRIMSKYMEPFSNLRRLFRPSPTSRNFNNLFDPDPYYDAFRKNIEACCEIAFRYDIVADEESGRLLGGRNIYQNSTLMELRVASLFENYFGRGCLKWDPPTRSGKIGEFILNIADLHIFTEVKTIEIQSYRENGTLNSNENSVENALRRAYEKVKEGIEIPFLVVLCHNHYNVEISDFEITRVVLGLLAIEDGVPGVISRGFCSPDIHRKLSAIGLYYYNFSPYTPEYFEIYHNQYANIQLDDQIFENKADKQFCLPEWNGNFE